MSFKTLSAILRGEWMIDQQYVENHLPFIASLLNKDSSFFSEDEKPKEISFLVVEAGANTGRSFSSYDQAPLGSFAVLDISGPILKHDNCGDAGSMTKARQLAEADKHPNIAGHIFKVDSPGGEVFGTQTFVDAVRNTTKPIVAFIEDGMAASAAYWYICHADHIIASNELSLVGSIGVFSRLADNKKALERMGYTVKDVYADQSSEKNKDVMDALDGKDEALKNNHLNPIADAFINSVKEGRAGKLNPEAGDPFKGKTYKAKEAISIGLIDEIGSFERAVEKLSELTQASQQSTNTNSNMKINFKAAWTGLAGLIGLSAFEGESQEVELTAEQLETMNARVVLAGELETKVTELAGSLTTEKEAREAAEKKANDLQAVVDAYGHKAGAQQEEPVKTSGDISDSKEEGVVDPNAEHNKLAEDFLK